MSAYTYVDGFYKCETEINRSRFISHAKGEVNAAEAADFVREIKAAHPQATHNCYAYVSGEGGGEFRFGDDGEPQGTAGQPILEVIKKKGLTHTAVVVTRYFGGIKLGANGLTAAYSGCAKTVLDASAVKTKRYSLIFKIECSYADFNVINSKISAVSAIILNSEFGGTVTLTLAAPVEDAERVTAALNDMTSGRAPIIHVAEEYTVY
ncbi:MAG: IMPACT family protein [Clostridiaceae bacterium]|jgi:uncharacterized YigZ family protein|nr:IMPACT family protein [Clostridiaceae bacterium]